MISRPVALPYKMVTLERAPHGLASRRADNHRRGIDPFWIVFTLGWCAGVLSMSVLVSLAQHFQWGVFS